MSIFPPSINRQNFDKFFISSCIQRLSANNEALRTVTVPHNALQKGISDYEKAGKAMTALANLLLLWHLFASLQDVQDLPHEHKKIS